MLECWRASRDDGVHVWVTCDKRLTCAIVNTDQCPVVKDGRPSLITTQRKDPLLSFNEPDFNFKCSLIFDILDSDWLGSCHVTKVTATFQCKLDCANQCTMI